MLVSHSLVNNMDVVWLKKDCRLIDHAPLHYIASSSSNRPCIILYLYEPDQLSEKTVHGSHGELYNLHSCFLVAFAAKS